MRNAAADAEFIFAMGIDPRRRGKKDGYLAEVDTPAGFEDASPA
jgi:hypothetical protein